MKQISLLFIITALLTFTSCDAQNPSRIGNAIKNAAFGNPTNTEISQALKQALEIGTSQGVQRLSITDGFLGNQTIKILFPPEAVQIEKTLRSIGLNSLSDKVVTSLNRAAEDAVKEAKPIFISAIKEMTITDATNILLGSSDAATQYFKRVTSAKLMEKFKPVITRSLSNVGATKYWGEATSRYNTLPLVKPINTDLSEYVGQKAIEGLFLEIAQEELKIRGSLTNRNTALLQKVFGYADKVK